MAALIRHGSLANPLKSTSALLAVNTTSARRDITRYKSKRPVKNPYPRLDATRTSLASKGFLRAQKGYVPPKDVYDRIDRICQSHAIPASNETKLEDPVVRFNLFTNCADELQYSIPNSVLYSIETIGDLKNFYKQVVSTNTPLDAMRSLELPKNLHIQYEYHRFHPDTDSMFGGKTAFPKSSTIVTSLKYKKKYCGFKQEDPYLDELAEP